MKQPNPSGEKYPGAPSWVKVFAISTLIVVLAVLAVAGASALGLHSIPGGGHGL